MFGANRNPDRAGNPAGIRQEEFKEDGQETYSDGQCSPQYSLPWRRHRVGLNSVSWRHVVLRPCGDRSIIEGLDLAPSDKREKWFVVCVVYKNIFQPVAVRVLEHGTQGSHSSRTIEL